MSASQRAGRRQLLQRARAAALDAQWVLKKDFPCARLLTLNRPAAMNATNLAMQCLLREHLMEQPHPRHSATQFSPLASHTRANDSESSERVTGHAGGATDGCVYIMRGAGGRSFCAGGDVVAMIHDDPPGTQLAASYIEYQLDHFLWRASHGARLAAHRGRNATAGATVGRGNRYVALWEGYVMGGGVGLSLHGTYRVAGPSTVFAMPETAIGFFPDVGASYFLPRLDVPSEYNNFSRVKAFPGLGLFMGLTGARLRGSDLLHCGLATHYVARDSDFNSLADALSSIQHIDEVENVLQRMCVASPPALTDDAPSNSAAAAAAATPLPPFSLRPHLKLLERCFQLHTGDDAHGRPSSLSSPVRSVEDVVARLQREQPTPFVQELLARLTPVTSSHNVSAAKRKQPNSPTALKVTLDMQRRGAAMDDLAPALRMEYAASVHACGTHDFVEGVSALLLRDKASAEARAPQWMPATLAGVSSASVDAFIAPAAQGTRAVPAWDPSTPFEDAE